MITISRVAHKIKNISIPGSRWGIDNPDSVYRVIPISNDQSYVIRGKLGKQQFNENHFTLWDDDMKTIGLISGNQIVADQKGNFEITVDSKNSSNRKNHIQTSKGAKEFYIRDTIIDWQNDRPNLLDVKNISQNKSNKPFSKVFLNKLPNNIKYLYFRGSSLCERVFLSRKYIKTKYTIISCDDEFYNPDGLLDCIKYLDKNLSTICCMGNLVLGFRKRKLGTVFFQMYPSFSKKFNKCSCLK